jgi:hypothetical protein
MGMIIASISLQDYVIFTIRRRGERDENNIFIRLYRDVFAGL